MGTRFKMGKVQPAAYKAMAALDDYVAQTGIDNRQQELIRIRASQINGCAYCVNEHSRDARKQGVEEHKVYLVSAWREAPNVFSEEEQLILTLTEEVTLIHQAGISDIVYEKAIALWGEEKTAKMIMTMISINAWNRIGVGLKMEPEV